MILSRQYALNVLNSHLKSQRIDRFFHWGLVNGMLLLFRHVLSWGIRTENFVGSSKTTKSQPVPGYENTILSIPKLILRADLDLKRQLIQQQRKNFNFGAETVTRRSGRYVTSPNKCFVWLDEFTS